MPHRTRRVLAILFLAAAVCASPGAAQRGGAPGEPRRPQPTRPARDAEPTAAETGTAVISGRVLVADTGAPVRRARVVARGDRRAHEAITDDLGRYHLNGLSAGTYTVTAAKPGFVNAAFGQRRPLGPATPLQLADGQQLARVDLSMPRGAVITGRVLDDAGEPLARATVSVQRYAYVRGERQLTHAGGDRSDDRGQYRVFGLPPGEYIVSATVGPDRIPPRLVNPPGARGLARPAAAVVEERQITGYAPTYYPGTTVAAEASPLRLSPSQELGGVDFQLQLVPLATVRGTIAGSDGLVFLVADHGRSVRAQSTRTSVRQDGTFAITDVAPGKYTLVGRIDGPEGTRTAILPIVLSGDDVLVTLAPVPPASLRGTVTFESASSSTPRRVQAFRVFAEPLQPLPGPRSGRPAQATDAGSFTVDDLVPGRYVIQATGPAGWTMKAVYLNGREITDEILEVPAGATSGFNVVFTDRATSLSGAVRDARGTGVAGVTVIAFPADAAMWRPQTRRIQTSRTDQNGEYRIAHLPSGEYLIAGVEDVEQGEWFDPEYLQRISSQASRMSIGEGEQKALDVKLP